MDTPAAVTDTHYTVVDKKKGRVRCNYCGKEVSGSTRLKQHLGGIPPDVLPCLKVPEDVKVQMKNNLMGRTKADGNTKFLKSFKSCSVRKRKSSSDGPCKDNHVSSQPASLSRKRKCHITTESGLKDNDEMARSLINPEQLNANTVGEIEKQAEDKSSRQIQRCIGRFFFENGIDFNAVNSPTFQKMMHASAGHGSTLYKVPSCNDLKGWILQEELKASQEYVRGVVHSWGTTGCSILLDGWIDGKGRNLINFVVDSPRGPVFMKSADVTDIIGDVVAMITLLSGVIEEVGVQNVVQIVSYTTLGSLSAVGKKLTEKYETISWTICAAHCIGLILEKIGLLDPWRGVLDKAKDITKFIYTHETVLKLMTKHTSGVELVSSRRIKSLTPFLILERIESQKNNLKIMFSSLEWKSSALASTAEGTRVTDLVTGDKSFWIEAQMLLKGSLPLIRALHLISGGDSKPQLGYIYETMDQVKETIKEEYEDEKTKYQPFWTVIDEIWSNQLHSPIHSVACILNPTLLYSSEDVDDDDEIKDGLSRCIEGIVKDKRARDLILLQLDDYLVASGAFGEGIAIDQKTKLSPVKWWSLYGGHCPELQSFAMRILSQTCTGASRYGLKRSLSEQLHMNGRNPVEQKQLTDLTYVHHNLRLQNAVSISNTDYRDIFLEEMDLMVNGLVEETLKEICD
ncbi:uncharacterized protein LOC113278231 isoform X1 [Papaver somniferum]|uniref:uncharacterized protein LOC113278231 isoform X1 n=2 Tax=Papaver somniferum TaxID=3469 RepID=UPI000E6F7FF6|nr:uncharacterized protein LOC113278231 isoform X1 [Papaver somniferum]